MNHNFIGINCRLSDAETNIKDTHRRGRKKKQNVPDDTRIGLIKINIIDGMFPRWCCISHTHTHELAVTINFKPETENTFCNEIDMRLKCLFFSFKNSVRWGIWLKFISHSVLEANNAHTHTRYK